MAQLTTLYINSKDRNLNSESSTKFKINLSPFGIINSTSFVIKSVTIPFSNYVTSAKNNNTLYPGYQYFTIREDIGLVTYDVKIPFGNYSYSQLATLVQDELNQASNGLTYKPYTVSFNTATNKFTIESSSVFAFDLLFSQQYANQSETNKISYSLGFDSTDINGDVGEVHSMITSTNVANLSGGMNLYIRSQSLTFSNSNFFNKSNDTIICAVPVLTAPNSIVCWVDQQILKQRCELRVANNIDFELVDENGYTIDLNGLNWSFVICFYNETV